MDRALTVYVLHCGNDARHNPDKTTENIIQSGVDIRIEMVSSDIHNFNELVPDSYWKLFIYSDEWFSKDLVKALPLYLCQDRYNVISIFRLEIPSDKIEPKVSISPRLFVSKVVLKNNSLQPANIQCGVQFLAYTNILDGFIFGLS